MEEAVKQHSQVAMQSEGLNEILWMTHHLLQPPPLPRTPLVNSFPAGWPHGWHKPTASPGCKIKDNHELSFQKRVLLRSTHTQGGFNYVNQITHHRCWRYWTFKKKKKKGCDKVHIEVTNKCTASVWRNVVVILGEIATYTLNSKHVVNHMFSDLKIHPVWKVCHKAPAVTGVKDLYAREPLCIYLQANWKAWYG